MERYATLCRLRRGDQGTRGMLFFEDFNCHTIELPWRENQRGISCIPPGEYECKIRISPKYGKIAGCILLGVNKGLLAGQWAVLNSRVAVRRFMDRLEMEPFTLRVLESF